MPKFSDFEVFDAFCHWLSDHNLGFYAINNEKYNTWLVNNGFRETPSETIITKEKSIWKLSIENSDDWIKYLKKGYIEDYGVQIFNQGDFIVACNNSNSILGIGIINIEFKFKTKIPKDKESLIPVIWAIGEQYSFSEEIFDTEIISELSNNDWNKIKEDYIINYPDLERTINALDSNEFPVFLHPKRIDCDLELPNNNICNKSLVLLNSKKHIMFTGAPGTGKTDLADKYL